MCHRIIPMIHFLKYLWYCYLHRRVLIWLFLKA
jgi:hypothetical protein